jgi:eukaryotic-like serine/threonine-protein kinase
LNHVSGFNMTKKIFGSNLCQIALLTLLVVMGMLWPFSPLERLENGYYDLVSSRFNIGKSPPVAVVVIDDKSLQAIGAWPWPRSIVAEMVQHLSDSGAQALGVMLLYSQESLNPGLEEVRNLRERNRIKTRESNKTTPQIPDSLFFEAEKRLNHDEQLVGAIKSARNVVLPFRLLDGTLPEGSNAKLSGMLIINSLKNPKKGTQTAGGISRLSEWTTKRREPGDVARPIREPYKELAGKAGAIGHLNLTLDPDGIVRRLPLLMEYKGRLLPSFALQMVIKYKKEPFKKIQLGQGAIQINDHNIPVDPSYRMLFSIQGSKIETYSFVDVMNGTHAPEQFKDAIVLLGITGGEYARLHRPAMGGEMSEVALFGHILSNMLATRHISRPVWAMPTEILVVLYFSVFLLFIVPRVSLPAAGFILGIFLATWAGISMTFFWVNGYWIKIFPPFILAVCGYGLLGLKTFALKKRYEKLEANKALGLTLQGQGMLDMALAKFMQCPIQDPSIKEALYNVGLDFERKRMANKALAVYKHIQTAGNFKDLKKRIKKLKDKGNVLAGTTANGRNGSILPMDDTETHPTLGRYEILKELGRGAMGTVFLGRDPRINREVAVKTLPYTEIEAHELHEFKTRFFREAEAAGRLSHPNIVSIYDAGEEHDMAYIAMELLEGRELVEYCNPDNLLPVEQVLQIISAVASALAYAHKQGVIHRDIKPSNIMLVRDDLIKVTDFGIARVVDASQTRTGITLGTPSYMSPEQVAGKKVDGRSDLFSLGVVFYELLTGKKPFAADSITAILYAITHSAYEPLSEGVSRVPPCCADIVDKLLKKGLTTRFGSASQVVKAVDACRAKL